MLARFLEIAREVRSMQWASILVITPLALGACSLIFAAGTLWNVWKIMVTQMVVKSSENYGELFNELNYIGRKFDIPEYDNVFSKLKEAKSVEEWRDLSKLIEVTDEDWERARKIKTFFRTIVYLKKTHFIRRPAFILMINHWGLELLLEVVYPLEKYRFFQSRELRPESVSRHVESEFYWYDELRAALPTYDPSLNMQSGLWSKIRHAFL